MKKLILLITLGLALAFAAPSYADQPAADDATEVADPSPETPVDPGSSDAGVVDGDGDGDVDSGTGGAESPATPTPGAVVSKFSAGEIAAGLAGSVWLLMTFIVVPWLDRKEKKGRVLKYLLSTGFTAIGAGLLVGFNATGISWGLAGAMALAILSASGLNVLVKDFITKRASAPTG